MNESIQARQLLTSRWNSVGINNSDSVLLHSNVKRLIRELIKRGIKNPLDIILDSFIDAVGTDGTLILPLFNFGFTSGVSFNVTTTPSLMGALTETARIRLCPSRSGHPVYSFCAFGKYADQIHEIDNESAYSLSSPFGFLRRINGKVASLDLEDQGSMTFFHHVEEVCQVDYRYMKWFESEYVDISSNISSRSYSIYVRNLEKGVRTHVNPAGDQMWRAGIYRGDPPGIDSGLRVALANDFFDFVENIILSGKAENLLFRYEKGF